MRRSLGIIMDPVEHVNIDKDTSFALLLEAQQRGWKLNYMELDDLYLRDGKAFANSRPLQVERNSQQWFQLGERQFISLSSLDLLLMRKDPPFNQEYIYATYLLEQAEAEGVLVVNRPQSLRDANEKLFTAWFPQCCCPTLVARRTNQFRSFLKEQGDIIVKPLDGMGGASIFRIRKEDPNLNVILEVMTEHESRFIMAQRYLPEISAGDKRILLIDGKPVDYALARIPAPGDNRGNLAVGGQAKGQPLTERDYWIANQVGPELSKKGLSFVGIDVIGDYLTEINVTSPTCVQELDRLYGLNISARLFDFIETRLIA